MNTEPVNTRAPAFPTDVGSFVVRGAETTSLAVTCKAQGYPVPLFRYTKMKIYLPFPKLFEIIFLNAIIENTLFAILIFEVRVSFIIQ